MQGRVKTVAAGERYRIRDRVYFVADGKPVLCEITGVMYDSKEGEILYRVTPVGGGGYAWAKAADLTRADEGGEPRNIPGRAGG